MPNVEISAMFDVTFAFPFRVCFKARSQNHHKLLTTRPISYMLKKRFPGSLLLSQNTCQSEYKYLSSLKKAAGRGIFLVRGFLTVRCFCMWGSIFQFWKQEKMARAKVQLKKIQNPVKRRVTFSKRKAGLLKKASELSLLCDAEVALIIFSPKGNLFEFANTSMNKVMGKYQNISSSTEHQIQVSENIETLRLEVENLGKRIAHLERENKHMIGEDLDSLSFKHLRYLEKKTILGVRKIRSRKDKISFERMASLKIKEQSLKKENANLGRKEINFETNRGVKDNMEADAATQQDLPKTNFNLCLS